MLIVALVLTPSELTANISYCYKLENMNAN